MVATRIFTFVALAAELFWLPLGHGSVGTLTVVTIVAVAVLTLLGGRSTAVATAVRIWLGCVFAGSVADRFGLFGAHGTAGVSWGSYSTFVEYTGTLLPNWAQSLASLLASAATVLELLVTVSLIFGIAPKIGAALATAIGISFAVAMWTSLGFGPMSVYAVPVVATGAAQLAFSDTRWRVDAYRTRVTRAVSAGS